MYNSPLGIPETRIYCVTAFQAAVIMWIATSLALLLNQRCLVMFKLVIFILLT